MLLSSLALFLLLPDAGGAIPTHCENPLPPEHRGLYGVNVPCPQSKSVEPFPRPPQPLRYQAGTASNMNAQLKKRQPPPPPPPPKDGTTTQRQPEVPVEGPKFKILWRGEIFRTPEDVQAVGDFDSHAKRIFDGKHPDYPGGMTNEMFHKGSSLYEHGTYKNPFSHYIPTSTSEEEARKFATKPDLNKSGYVYKIRSSPDMVDVSASLGGTRHYKNAHEREVAGVYDIPWRQVEGWQKSTYNPTTKGYEVGEFVQNPKFALVDGAGTYSSQPSLAGFPEGHLAWGEKPWAQFKDVPVEGMLNEYVLKHRLNNDMEAFNKLRSSPWRSLPCSGRLVKKNSCLWTDVDGDPNAKMARLAKKISDNEFQALMTKQKLIPAADRWKKPLSEIRTNIVEPLVSKLKPPRSVIKGLPGTNILPGPIELTSVVLTTAFTPEMTDLDRARIGTSLLPLVGCAVGAAADGQDGKFTSLEGIDAALCFIGDALLLGGVTAPLKAVMDFIRTFVAVLTMGEPKTAKASRDEGWASLVDSRMIKLVSDKAFRIQLESSVALDAMVLASYSAHWIGELVANATIEWNTTIEGNTTTDLNATNLPVNVREQVHTIRSEASAQILRRQRQFLLKEVCVNFAATMTSVASEYNKQFIEKWVSSQSPPPQTGSLSFKIQLDIYYKDLKETKQKLQNELPAAPSNFTLAYYIGVAAGIHGDTPRRIDDPSAKGFALGSASRITAVRREVFDPVQYYIDHAGKGDPKEVVDRHTLAVAHLFLGKITEDGLPDDTTGLSNVREFQMLIAMNIGRLYADFVGRGHFKPGQYLDSDSTTNDTMILENIRILDSQSMIE